MGEIQSYIKSIENIPTISKDEEKRLARIIHGDSTKEEIDKAINSLVIANLRLVISRATKFLKSHHGNFGIMDLISDGNLALLKAAKRYKPTTEAAFGTYATSCIDKCFFQTMRIHDIIRVPQNQTEKLNKLNRVESAQEEQLDDQDKMEILGIKESSLDFLNDAKRVSFVKSLDEPMRSDESGSKSLVEIIESQIPPPDHEPNIESIGEFLKGKMERILTPRERKILEVAYLEGPTYTYKELAEKMSVSPERCRQLLRKSLHKMRRSICG